MSPRAHDYEPKRLLAPRSSTRANGLNLRRSSEHMHSLNARSTRWVDSEDGTR